MNNSPKAKGERSEGQVMAALLRAGKTVLMPFGDNQRYDLVVEENGSFSKIQCKTGHLRDGSVIFNAHSTHYHRGGTSQGYKGQVDFFAVYCPDNNKIYLIPIDDVGTSKVYLRVVPAKSGRKNQVTDATKYELLP